jgi:predicted RNA-binding protein YlqC (UPF0109 family)
MSKKQNTTKGTGKGGSSINDMALNGIGKVGSLRQLPVEVLAAVLVGALCEDPTQARVYVTAGETSTLVEFAVKSSDKWRIVGKKGHTIKSIASICKSYAKSQGNDVALHIGLLEDSSGRNF